LKRIQPLLILVMLVLAILAVDAIFFHFIFPQKKQMLLQQMNSAVQEDLRSDPPLETLALSISQQPNKNEFSAAIKKCLGIESSQFENFPTELISSVGLESKWIEVENYDLRSSTGQKFRIHVLQESPQKAKTVQFFNLDQEGTFVPVALEPDLRLMQADLLISKLKEKGQVEFYQTKERWVLKNHQVLAVTFENKKVVEFQLFTDHKTFACENADCFCY
jgi:hypothetical protein